MPAITGGLNCWCRELIPEGLGFQIHAPMKKLWHLLILRPLLIILFNAVSVCSFCQTATMTFEHIGVDAGLSQSNGTCILQDSRGFMWFGTQDGLNRYDGYKFVVYKSDPRDPASLSNSFVKDILEDSRGNIWVATLGGGLNKFDRELDRFIQYRHDKTNINSLSDDFVNCIAKDSGGIYGSARRLAG
jgi:hypothetical protein